MKNTIVGLEGNFLVGFNVELPEMYSLGENDFDILNDSLSKALKDLPDNTIFVKHDNFNDKYIDTTNYPTKNYLQTKTKEYFKTKEYRSHSTKIFFVQPNTLIKNERLKNPFRPPSKKIFEEYDKKQEDFFSAVNQCVKFINNIVLSGKNTIKLIPFDNGLLEYWENWYSGLNEDFVGEIKKDWNNLRVANDYVAILKFPQEDKFPQTMTTCKKNSDKSTDKSIFFKNYGEQFSFDLGFKHSYVQIAVLDEKKVHINEAVKNNQNLKKSSSIDRTNKFWAEETEKDLDELTKDEDNNRLIRGHNNVIIYAQTPEQLEYRISETIDAFKDLDIKPIRLYGDNLLAVFEYSYPINATKFVENHFYVSSLQAFCSLLILTGKYNDDAQGVLLNSRLDNVPVKVDTWDEQKKYMFARNFMVLARTGLGKSVLLNHIISNFVEEYGKVVLVDLGGSYKKLASLFPNRTAYITHKIGDKLGINPFNLKGEKPNAEKLEELAEYIGIHYKLKEGLNDNERVSLKKILDLYYKNVEKGHSLPDFVNAFILDRKEILDTLEIKDKFFDDEEFVLQMSEYVGKGPYAYLYDGEGEELSEDLYDKDIIVFELDQIRGNNFLLSLMLHQIYHTINKVVWRDTETRGKVIFEEFAEQLKWDGMMSKIEWFAQAIRKQNSSLGLVLQAISQFPETDGSKSIIENTQMLFVLGAKDYKPIQERFGLSDHAYYQLNSIKSDFSSERPYSEVFVLRGDKHQVYRLELPRHVFWAYQTDGHKNAILMRLYEIMGNMERAIDLMVERENELIEVAELRKNKLINGDEADQKLKLLISKYANYEHS